MPRRNYIHKNAYKQQKRKLEEQTKDFVKKLSKQMGIKNAPAKQ